MKKIIQKFRQKSVLPAPMIIAVDFDGTCVTENYPQVGVELPGATQTLHALSDYGHKLILWTCREGKELEDAVKWFEDREIPLYAVNQTPSEAEFRSGLGRKVFANLYLDDRSFPAFPGWKKLHEHLLGKALKPW